MFPLLPRRCNGECVAKQRRPCAETSDLMRQQKRDRGGQTAPKGIDESIEELTGSAGIATDRKQMGLHDGSAKEGPPWGALLQTLRTQAEAKFKQARPSEKISQGLLMCTQGLFGKERSNDFVPMQVQGISTSDGQYVERAVPPLDESASGTKRRVASFLELLTASSGDMAEKTVAECKSA